MLWLRPQSSPRLWTTRSAVWSRISLCRAASTPPSSDGPSDGIGRTVRNGLNFTERGFGVRGAVGSPDRGNTAASQLKPGDIDWEHIFGKLGVRWFHTGGIFAALSETTAEVTVEAVKAANKHGTIVSYDLNYRPVALEIHRRPRRERRRSTARSRSMSTS